MLNFRISKDYDTNMNDRAPELHRQPNFAAKSMKQKQPALYSISYSDLSELLYDIPDNILTPASASESNSRLTPSSNKLLYNTLNSKCDEASSSSDCNFISKSTQSKLHSAPDCPLPLSHILPGMI